jgi:hypothetical protein
MMDQFNGLIMFAAQKYLYAAEGTRRLATFRRKSQAARTLQLAANQR